MKNTTARELVDKIWGTEDMNDISDFIISLDSVVSMMEKYAAMKVREFKHELSAAHEVVLNLPSKENIEKLKALYK